MVPSTVIFLVTSCRIFSHTLLQRDVNDPPRRNNRNANQQRRFLLRRGFHRERTFLARVCSREVSHFPRASRRCCRKSGSRNRMAKARAQAIAGDASLIVADAW